ncbi:hypothetical protein JRQ81_005260 [Phrynocephalus forsythii]|uniref:Beta-defensin n=1 Tax=Phrynocephalus forsythii TaxID=171643 RepID=A0A9Q0Y3S4_9SAUR|nr:hypothetical protein JRQ81_005260 [Phrynocephalus forsythii]
MSFLLISPLAFLLFHQTTAQHISLDVNQRKCEEAGGRCSGEMCIPPDQTLFYCYKGSACCLRSKGESQPSVLRFFRTHEECEALGGLCYINLKKRPECWGPRYIMLGSCFPRHTCCKRPY